MEIFILWACNKKSQVSCNIAGQNSWNFAVKKKTMTCAEHLLLVQSGFKNQERSEIKKKNGILFESEYFFFNNKIHKLIIVI